MKAVIVGSGLAGTMAAKTLRELDPDVEIEVLGEETYPYYPRPNLIEFLAGRLAFDRLFAFPPDWNDRQRIQVRTGDKVVRLLPADRRVETAGGKAVAYDILLLASGSRPLRPPVKGSDRKGVFVLRTLSDAQDDVTLAPDLTTQELLIFAARKEKAAMDLYTGLAGRPELAAHRKIFEFLAGQERAHKVKLEAAYEERVLTED